MCLVTFLGHIGCETSCQFTSVADCNFCFVYFCRPRSSPSSACPTTRTPSASSSNHKIRWDLSEVEEGWRGGVVVVLGWRGVMEGVIMVEETLTVGIFCMLTEA